MKNIIDFINYNSKKVNVLLVIAHYMALFTAFFIFFLFKRTQFITTSILMFLIILYTVSLVVFLKFHKSPNINFLLTGSFSAIFSLYLLTIIAGFMKNHFAVLMFEILMYTLYQIFVVYICFRNIKKGAFGQKKDSKTFPIGLTCGILGFVLGKFIFSFIDSSNYSWIIYFIIILILLYSTGSSDLLRYFLYKSIEKNKYSNLIRWLSVTRRDG